MIQQLFSHLTRDWVTVVAEQHPAPTLAFIPGKLELSRQVRDRTPRPQSHGYLVTQEFKQSFQVAVGAPEWVLVEKWSSLFLAMLATDQDDLRQRYNRTMNNAYREGGFVSRHHLDQLVVLEGMPDLTNEQPCLNLLCQANGRLELGQQTPPSVELIQEVVITGADTPR